MTDPAAPLRVLHVVRTFDLSGRSRMIHDLCAGLAPRCASAVVCLTGAPGFQPENLEIITLDLPPDGFSFHGMMQLTRLVGERRIDVIHSHGRGATPYAAGARLIHRRARLVHTVHRADGDLLSGRSVVREPALKAMDRIVAVSRAAADAFAVMNNADEAAIEIIPNGIDLDRFASARTAERTGCRLCSVANLSADKDPETLLKALAIVRQQRPAATLRIVGDGPRRGEIHAAVTDLGLTEAVELTGFRSDIPEILAEADVFMHAAHTEGLGIAVLEAMAAGVPVVATATGGLMEIVRDGETGLVVEPGDPEAMAAGVLRLLDNNGLRTSCVKQAAELVQTSFSVAAMCESYVRVYGELVS